MCPLVCGLLSCKGSREQAILGFGPVLGVSADGVGMMGWYRMRILQKGEGCECWGEPKAS